MDLSQEYKELYYHEIEHSDRLNNKISTCLTLLTILGSGELFLWKSIISKSYITTQVNLIDWNFTTFSFTVFVSLCFFVISIINFIKAYSGYEYDYFPIKGFQNFVNDTYNAVKNIESANEIANKHITKTMEHMYIKCTINNRNQNSIKNRNHRSANIWIIRTLISIVISFIYSIVFISHIYR